MLDFSYNFNCNFAVLGNCGLIHLVIIICHIVPFSIITCASYSDSVKISFKVCLVVTSCVAAKVSPIATHKQKNNNNASIIKQSQFAFPVHDKNKSAVCDLQCTQ